MRCASPSGSSPRSTTLPSPIRRMRPRRRNAWPTSFVRPHLRESWLSSTAPTWQSSEMTRAAVYPGSFDPITKGHEDLIHRSLEFVDQLIVAVAVNVAKQPLFSLEERVALIRQAVRDKRVEVQSFEGLLAEFAKQVGSAVIVRGLRAVSDFEYEFQMALMNRNLAPHIETVFLVPAFDLTYLSSSLVREVARFGGDVSQLVDPTVQQALKRKFSQ